MMLGECFDLQMRQQELIHLHALLVEIRNYLEDQEELSADPYVDYDTFDVSPTAIDRTKDVHLEAMTRLMDGIQTKFDDYQLPSSTYSTSSNHSEPPTP